MKKYISFLVLSVFFCANVSATDFYRERIIIGAGISIIGDKSLLFIDITGDKSGMSNCATTGRFAINSSAPHYKEMVSIAMAAYVSEQKTVDLHVAGTCNYHGNA